MGVVLSFGERRQCIYLANNYYMRGKQIYYQLACILVSDIENYLVMKIVTLIILIHHRVTYKDSGITQSKY